MAFTVKKKNQLLQRAMMSFDALTCHDILASAVFKRPIVFAFKMYYQLETVMVIMIPVN